jgi:MAE_28990/MAE_18760-like HEPN
VQAARASLIERREQFDAWTLHLEKQADPTLRKMLVAGAYLQLYSIIESTIALVLDELNKLVRSGSARILHDNMLREWLRAGAQTHDPQMTGDNRLERVSVLARYMLTDQANQDFEIDVPGANWDDKEIESFCKRLGCTLDLDPLLVTRVKRIRPENTLGILALVKDKRNKIAHGNISFVEAGETTSSHELKEYRDVVFDYMRAIIDRFERFVRDDVFRSSGTKDQATGEGSDGT